MTSIGLFISILTDFGFKQVFADEKDTSFLRKTIQIMIGSKVPIREVRITNTHKKADVPDDRGAVYDVSCIDDNERRFIVEMQRSKLNKFIHRTKFYSYFLLNEMVKKGGEIKYNELHPIYTISFLDGKVYPTQEFHHIVCLRNQHGELIDNQITHVMLELGKWNKAEHEVKTDLDKLILLMKFTDTATAQDPIPEVLLKEKWTARILEKLKMDNLTSEERVTYQMALARQASIDEMDRIYEEGMKKVEDALTDVEAAKQKAETAEQKVEVVKQEAEAAKQKAETAEQKVEVVKQEAEVVKQEAEAAKQEAEAAKQKAEAAEQKAEAAKQQVEQTEAAQQAAIKKLLQKGTFTDKDIAEIFDIDITSVQQIKNELES